MKIETAAGSSGPERDTKLILEYLKEHYTAARHQQTVRLQSLAMLLSASAVIFVLGMQHMDKTYNIFTKNYSVRMTFITGVALLVLATITLRFNQHFHRAGRYHVQVAKQTRDALRDYLRLKSGVGATSAFSELEDPNLIGEAVRIVFDKRLCKRERQRAYKEALQAAKNGEEQAGAKIGDLMDKTLRAIPRIIAFAGCTLLFLSFFQR